MDGICRAKESDSRQIYRGGKMGYPAVIAQISLPAGQQRRQVVEGQIFKYGILAFDSFHIGRGKTLQFHRSQQEYRFLIRFRQPPGK